MTYVVVTLVVLFFLNIYCSGVSHKLFYQSKEASMIEKCLLASDEISTLEVLNSSTVTGIVNQLESLKVTRLVVTDHGGAALYDSSGASVGTYVLLPEILQALTVSKQAPEGNNVFTWTYHDGITDSRAATPIVYYGTVVGCVYMTEYDTTQGTLIKSLQQTLLRITLMLEIIVAAFSVAFSNAFSRRLNRIMASMRIIREGDYSHKVDMGGSDELTVLGEEFNDLTERLQTSERKRSQFVSDASHELKTPLASIKLLTDSIFRQMLNLAGMMYALTIKVIAPVMAALFLVELALALMSRAAPQVHIMEVGFPLKIAVGFFFVAMLFGMLSQDVRQYILGLDSLFINLLRAMSPGPQ